MTRPNTTATPAGEQLDQQSPTAAEGPATEQPVTERGRELAELEQKIRRQLRSNQRFLERFMDEDFVDDEGEDDDASERDDEEL
jgi:hypothetical protein